MLIEEERQLALSESHRLALNERIEALEDRIDNMTKNGKDTRAQRELLCIMQGVIESINQVQSQLKQKLKRGDRRYQDRPNL